MATGRLDMVLDREGTSMSMVSQSSTASRKSRQSHYGPLSRQSLQRHNKVRVKSAKGTRYVIKYNSVHFKVERIEDAPESDTEESQTHRRGRRYRSHLKRSKTDVSEGAGHLQPRICFIDGVYMLALKVRLQNANILSVYCFCRVK